MSCSRLILSTCFLGLLTWTNVVYGQISSYQAQVRNEIERRGLDEEQLRALLYERNIDLDNLDILTSEQILELRRAIDELDQCDRGWQLVRRTAIVPRRGAIAFFLVTAS